MNNQTNIQSKVYLSQYTVSRPRSEMALKQDFTVIFANDEKGIKKQILDSEGNIADFPGVEFCPTLKEELGNRAIEPQIKFEAKFEKSDDDKILMVWTVRPDGRYWMDSWGFGAEDYECVELYSCIDLEGNFTAPFKLYSIGYKFYGNEDKK